MLSIKTPDDVAHDLAQRLKARRLEHAWTREALARRAGITVASLKRFELTGEIALKRLLAVCFVLESLDIFDQVLQPPPAKSIAELETRTKQRQRGRRKT